MNSWRSSQKEGCSRIPIYEEFTDNIIGVVHAKDVLKYWSMKGDLPGKDAVNPPYFVPEGKKLVIFSMSSGKTAPRWPS